MSEVFSQGLFISLAGLVVTFLALGALILVIYLLEWVFRVAPDNNELFPKGEQVRDKKRTTQRVAIAVAAWYLNQKKTGDLGERLLQPPSEYWRQDEK